MRSTICQDSMFTRHSCLMTVAMSLSTHEASTKDLLMMASASFSSGIIETVPASRAATE